MRRIYLFHLICLLCLNVFVLFTVMCIFMMTDVLNSTPIDLGFNNMIDDSCDDWDYSDEATANYTTKSRPLGMSLLQFNICGVLGKQNLLNTLLSDIK